MLFPLKPALYTALVILAGNSLAIGQNLPEMKFKEVKEVAPGVFFRFSSISATDKSVPFGGSNNIWVVFEDHVAVIDANFPDGAEDVVAAIKKTTNKPIRYVFDTHHHGDHAYGNSVFFKEGATVVAQSNCARLMREFGPAEFEEAGKGPTGRKDVASSFLKSPGIVFDDRLVLDDVNNLAGVPSIMYAILGAYVFVELIFKPLESPAIAARNTLGGGLTLALLVLPIIIVSTQEAIRAVPVSLRHASLALGASRWQTIWKIVIPSSLPGILTGMILALSRAMGEAAPLVLFGAALYVNFSPSLFSRFTALPMQIYSWSDDPDPAFHYNAALASAILITMLLGLNSIAIFFRYFVQQKLKG